MESPVYSLWLRLQEHGKVVCFAFPGRSMSVSSVGPSEIDHEPIEHGIISSVCKGAFSGMSAVIIAPSSLTWFQSYLSFQVMYAS